MVVIQNKIIKIGPVLIGQGFKKNKPNQQLLYPVSLIADFLNVDVNNYESIDRFCQQYRVIPRDWTNGYYEGFKSEQNIIRSILERIQNNKLSKIDIDKINLEIGGISSQLTYVSEKYFIGINSQLDNTDSSKENAQYAPLSKDSKKQYLAKLKRHPNTFSAIYDWLADLVINQRAVKVCSNCGKYFVPHKYSPWQKYCNDSCKERYTSRKKYHKKVSK